MEKGFRRRVKLDSRSKSHKAVCLHAGLHDDAAFLKTPYTTTSAPGDVVDVHSSKTILLKASVVLLILSGS